MKYPALKDPSRDLRLLLLKSVQFVQKSGCFFNGKPIEIICETHSFSPEETPEYVALSYPWKGQYYSNPISRYVLLNGVIVKLGENAAAALWTLRPQSADIYIWVDSLCIDQKNAMEMDLQIKRMHEIYSQATRTKVWLGVMGVRLDEDDDMMEQIRKISTRAIETGLYDALKAMRAAAERGEDSEARSWQNRANALVVQIHDSTEWSFGITYGFLDFQEMYYWKRIWILQEVALSPHLDFFYGITRESLSLEQIQAAAALFKLGLDRAGSGQDMTGGFDFSKKGLLSFRVKKFGIPLPSGPSSSPMSTVLELRDRYQVTPKDGLSLMELVLLLYAGQDETGFTEPKDTVFALLSLATNATQFRDRLRYTMGLDEIFCETARVIIENGQVDILAYCTPNTAKSEQGAERMGPSWAPAWASYISRPICGSPLKTAFASSGRGPFPGIPARDSRKPQQLALHGVLVDTIESVGTSFQWETYANKDMDYCNASAQLEYMYQILRFYAQSREKRSEIDSEDLSAVYVTPVADRLVSSQGSILVCDRDRQYFIKGWQDLRIYLHEHVRGEGGESESQVLSEELIAYFQSMGNCYGASPLLSVEGYVGVARGAEPGDQIYLFAGAQFPYILRELKDNADIADQEDRFQLVGAAYVHGIMYGELLRSEPATAWREVILV